MGAGLSTAVRSGIEESSSSSSIASFNDDQDIIGGVRVGNLVLPAQGRSYTSAQHDSYIAKRKEMCEAYELEARDEKVACGNFSLAVQSLLPRQFDKVIIYFVGNGEFYQDRLIEMEADYNATGAAIIGFNYPNVADSKNNNDLSCLKNAVDSAIKIVEHLLKTTELASDDFIFKTHSLGGAIGTRTAAQLHNSGRPVFLFNGRSFANINSVIAEPATSTHSLVTFGTSATGWGSKPYEDYVSIPDEYKTFITAENDPVIKTPASILQAELAKTEPAKQLQLIDEHRFGPKPDRVVDQHNCPLTQLYNAKGQSAQQYFLNFFDHACELKEQNELAATGPGMM